MSGLSQPCPKWSDCIGVIWGHIVLLRSRLRYINIYIQYITAVRYHIKSMNHESWRQLPYPPGSCLTSPQLRETGWRGCRRGYSRIKRCDTTAALRGMLIAPSPAVSILQGKYNSSRNSSRNSNTSNNGKGARVINHNVDMPVSSTRYELLNCPQVLLKGTTKRYSGTINC